MFPFAGHVVTAAPDKQSVHLRGCEKLSVLCRSYLQRDVEAVSASGEITNSFVASDKSFYFPLCVGLWDELSSDWRESRSEV